MSTSSKPFEWPSRTFANGEVRYQIIVNVPTEMWCSLEGILKVAKKTVPTWKTFMPNGWPKKKRRRRKPDKIEDRMAEVMKAARKRVESLVEQERRGRELPPSDMVFRSKK